MERLRLLSKRWAYARLFISGFSIIELLIVLSAIAVLMMVGVPSFGRFISEANISGDSQKLQSILSLVRMEAVTTGERVVLCRWDGAAGCTGGSQYGTKVWTKGALAFIDRNRNRLIDLPQDEVIKVISFSDTGQITWNRGEALVYEGDGSVYGGSNGTFTITQSTEIKKIVISMTGRVRRSS